MTEATNLERPRWPRRGWIGLLLALAFWVINWTVPGKPAVWAFFPMWLGYCLVVDALVFRRKGTSMLARSPAGFVALFFISAPVWWLFELINERAQNWIYVYAEGVEPLTPAWRAVAATLNFSTVIPAVFGTAELAATFGWIARRERGPIVPASRGVTVAMFAAGWIALALLLAWPRYFFPLLWLSVYLLLDPVNVWLGNRSLLHATARGDWRPVLALAVGCLICGFFWEMWNFYSSPKWLYQVPFVSFLHVFEMPLLGYGGYMPFSWELFALHHLVTGGAGRTVRIGDGES